ncbi:DNA polymerase epsilon subunit 4-like [Rhopilema esculentum]|uniref:DNA polymerase epsilon subunit 4-like n=1 Tax=Rhopilema esculentum TaxID=499914 RepID=UPI0031DB32D9
MAASSIEIGYEEMEAENGDIDLTQSPPDDSVAQADGEEKQSNSRLAQLPHTRVRNMMKLDSDLHIASQDSVFLVTKAAELFIQFIAKEAHQKCVQSKRKTIQKRDLDTVVLDIDSMAFLEGVLD